MRISVLALAAILPLSAGLAENPATALPPGHPPIDGAQSMPAPTMTRIGKVAETIDAPPYVYLRVTGDGGEQWLAAPALKLPVGSRIRWEEGLAMRNFHSKTLDRTFDVVYFVNGVSLAK